LHVSDTGTTSVDDQVRFLRPALASGNYYSIGFGRALAAGESAFLEYHYNSTTADSFLGIGNYGDAVDGGTGLIVRKGGNVGIGVTDPDSPLEVLSTSTQQKWSYDTDSFATLAVADNSNTTIATGESGDLTLDAAGNIVLDADGGDITFKDRATSALVFDMDEASGQCNIQNGAGNTVVAVDDGDRRLYFYDKGGEHIAGDGTDLTISSGDDIILSPGGNVGIGAAPTADLSIESSDTADSVIRINHNNALGDPFLKLTTDNVNWAVGLDNSDSDKFMVAAGATPSTNPALTIDTAGKVGIGVTSPVAELSVSGSMSVEFNNYTGNTTVATTDYIVNILGSGARTVTLPLVATAGQGKILVIKDGAGNSAAGNITIIPSAASSDTIDGNSTSTVLNSNYGSVSLVSDGGTKWFIY
tara:strand:- start:1109 stop:2356 length:1248 start_codon:yes stop_codon:yes gene_type:complete